MIKELCNGVGSRPRHPQLRKIVVDNYRVNREGKMKPKSNIRVLAEEAWPNISLVLTGLWIGISHVLVALLSLTGFFLVIWLFCPSCKSYASALSCQTVYLWYTKYYNDKWNWLKYAHRRKQNPEKIFDYRYKDI